MSPSLRTLSTPPSAVATPITRHQMQALRADMEAALAKVALKHGLSVVEVGEPRLTASGFNFIVRAEQEQCDCARNDWSLYAEAHGLEPTWLDATVRLPYPNSPGREYVVAGLRTSYGAPHVKLVRNGSAREHWVPLPKFLASATLAAPAAVAPAPLHVVRRAAD